MTDKVQKIWLTVVENPRYEVSNYGDLCHKKRKHILNKNYVYGDIIGSV